MKYYYCPRCKKEFNKEEKFLMCSSCGLQLSVHKIEKKEQKRVFVNKLRPIVRMILLVLVLGGSVLFISQRSKIGEMTENGGIIFFDKLFYSNGWRYLEVSPINLSLTSWSSSPSSKVVSELSNKFGLGAYNTYSIVYRLGSNTAAYKASNYGRTEDWYLGNVKEMQLLYYSLKLPMIKKTISSAEKFSLLQNENKDQKGRHVYWVSELETKDKGYAINFEDGEVLSVNIAEKCYVRPIRKF